MLKNSLLFKIAGGVKGGSDGGTNQSVTAVTYRCVPLWCGNRLVSHSGHTPMTPPSQRRGQRLPRMQGVGDCAAGSRVSSSSSLGGIVKATRLLVMLLGCLIVLMLCGSALAQ